MLIVIGLLLLYLFSCFSYCILYIGISLYDLKINKKQIEISNFLDMLFVSFVPIMGTISLIVIIIKRINLIDIVINKINLWGSECGSQ